VGAEPHWQSEAVAHPTTEFCALTPDGRYIMYAVMEFPRHDQWTTIVQSVDGSWRRTFVGPVGGTPRQMTHDGQRFVLRGAGDTLIIGRNGTDSQVVRTHVGYAELFNHGADDWLMMQRSDPAHGLTLRSLGTGQEYDFTDATGYRINPQVTTVLLTRAGKDSTQPSTVSVLDLSTKHVLSIWSGRGTVGTMEFDRQGEQIAFMVSESRMAPTVWHYKPGMAAARAVVDRSLPTRDPHWMLENRSLTFSHDGHHLFVTLGEVPDPVPPPTAVKVDVWNYRDAMAQSDQQGDQALDPMYFTVPGRIDLPSGQEEISHDTLSPQVQLLADSSETVSWRSAADGDHIVIKTPSRQNRLWWDSTVTFSYSWGDPITGERRPIQTGVPHQLGWSKVSPDGTWLAYYDAGKHHWFSYATSDGTVRNISRTIPFPMYALPFYRLSDAAVRADRTSPRGFVGWVTSSPRESTREVSDTTDSRPVDVAIVYDEYDLWAVDLTGKTSAVNLTNGYGRRHRMIFVHAHTPEPDSYTPTFAPGDTILLSGYDPRTKINGFCRLILPARGQALRDPECGTMSLHTMYVAYYQLWSHIDHRLFLEKADKAPLWIVRRESATEAPNLFLTRDFKAYTPISDVQPYRKYNWLTAELVHWTSSKGQPTLGVLYKPEDFDPQKKYPVIVSIYEGLSDELTRYPEPDWSSDQINVAYFVSRGYLVLLPDIYKRAGEIGASALESVESAARWLGTLPYVDRAHMGLTGHSYGGFETNYIVTRTSVFAAAMSSEGMSDLVSDYGNLRGVNGLGRPNQNDYENGQPMMWKSLWEDPKRYMDNSPLLRAPNVKTPMLILQNRQDYAVTYQQGFGWFLALRRLGKPAWMLQYDDGDHAVQTTQDARDRTLRILQFFDHYLKGAPPPRWMTHSIPTRRRGIDTGLELDTTRAPVEIGAPKE